MHNLGFGNGFLYMTSKAEVTKEKTDELDFIKITDHCVVHQRKLSRE